MVDELVTLLSCDRETARQLLDTVPPEFRAQGHRIYQGRFGPDEAVLEVALADPDLRVGIAAVSAIPLERLSPQHAERWMKDRSWLVAEFGAYLAGELEDSRLVPALCDLVTSHAELLVREAALASLGAIGDPRAIPVVVDALASKNVYLRRRALVISVAFDTPEIEAAVERLRDDRDAQIRQLFVDLERDPYQ